MAEQDVAQDIAIDLRQRVMAIPGERAEPGCPDPAVVAMAVADPDNRCRIARCCAA